VEYTGRVYLTTANVVPLSISQNFYILIGCA